MDAVLQHELIQKLLKLADEIGRTPSKVEYLAEGHSEFTMRKAFGTYTEFIKAAGLEPIGTSKKKIDNTVFNVDIEKHLSEYTKKEIATPSKIQEPFKKCLFIPDFHAPWGDLKVIEAACKFAEIHKPDYIVQLGDLYDFISHSRFPTSKNIYTPREEQKAGRAQSEEMWKMLISASAKSKKYQLWGNHSERPLKRILETYPEAEDWVRQMVTELMTFKGVETVDDSRTELILPGNVMAIHGYLSRPGSHRDYNLGFNVVHGHLHTAHVMFKKIQGRVLFEMNCGIAADIHSKAFTYTPQKSTAWASGFGWLDENGPRFVPVF